MNRLDKKHSSTPKNWDKFRPETLLFATEVCMMDRDTKVISGDNGGFGALAGAVVGFAIVLMLFGLFQPIDNIQPPNQITYRSLNPWKLNRIKPVTVINLGPTTPAKPAVAATPPKPLTPSAPPPKPKQPVETAKTEEAAAKAKAEAEAAKAEEEAAAKAKAEAEASAAENHETNILNAVTSWANAWSTQKIDDYINSYASDFKPKQYKSREYWEAQRRKRLSRPSSINIQLSNIQINLTEDGNATVTFIQIYKSPSFTDQVRKTLVLKQESGIWKINSETAKQL
ncbi:hypothetical protein ACFL3U_03255 [Pseudomonadota bacterium]